jgi:hypothetical protein
MWENNIIQKYPKTFKSLHYLECNEGWKEIIDEVSAKIEAVNNKYSPSSYIHAAQIKQKFGGLRYYINIEDIDEQDVKYVYEVIAEAESKSFTVCEVCGQHASSAKDRRYYIETLCDEHRISRR